MKRTLTLCIFGLSFFYNLLSFGLANPASVNCVKQGNQSILIKNVGICLFPDGSYCEEWAFFKGKCSQGQNAFPGGKYDQTKKMQYCITKINKISTVKMCKMGMKK